jgi:hypothetical protein
VNHEKRREREIINKRAGGRELGGSGSLDEADRQMKLTAARHLEQLAGEIGLNKTFWCTDSEYLLERRRARSELKNEIRIRIKWLCRRSWFSQ